MSIEQAHPFLSKRTAIVDKIRHIRQELNQENHGIDRISLVVYHEERNTLQTYAMDEEVDGNFSNYEVKFDKCESLVQIANEKKARIINDLKKTHSKKARHTGHIEMAGYQSSYTMPLYFDNKLMGFFFANSRTKNAINEALTQKLGLISIMVTLTLHQDLSEIKMLKSTVESMKLVSQYRDPETGEHLKRMAYFSLIIARSVAKKYHLSDTFIEHLFLYAPLHDIGKLTVPDSILLKPGRLTVDEYEQMKLHTLQGRDLIENLITIYQLSDMPHIDILKNIVHYHHEQLDGKGYPKGLSGTDIPIEAKIVTVADIFDALTSNRPYKKAWTNQAAFGELYRLSETKIEYELVYALEQHYEEIVEIQQLFEDEQHDWMIPERNSATANVN